MTTRKKTPAARMATTPPATEAALDKLVLLARRQVELLEGIFAATARTMLIAEQENRFAGEMRRARDIHGLRQQVLRLLAADAVLRDLTTTTDGSRNEENSGNPLPPAGGDH